MRGPDYGGVAQLMLRIDIDQRLIGKTSYLFHSQHSVLERDWFGARRFTADLDHVMTCFGKQLSDAEQHLLGIAALLGMEVSVHEAARVADTSPYEIAVTFSRAVTIGILVERQGDCFSFVHAEMRNAISASLEPDISLAAHARAATLLTGSTPERVLRRTQHAFTAARRSTEDAITAVHIAREAAAALQAADDFGQAAALLGQAVELHEAAALPGPFAAIVVEHAEAVLACGRLAEARPLFHRAAQVAETEENPVIFARAALGLGGVWVREHRMTEEAERVGALQRRALDTLPDDATVLRTRLMVRLAAESVYRGGSLTAVIEGVDAARRTGDARALAEALSLYHHALLTPEHTKPRLAIANELIAVASAAGDKLLSLMGLCWRAADLFLLGDPYADMALMELRLRAETLRCRSVLFIVQAMEVMLAIRAGRLAQAEQAAAACYALGMEVGDADALVYYGAHLAAIRVFQGREVELADLAVSVAASPVLTERDRAFATAAALFALRRGDAHQARVILERLKRDGLDSIVPTSSWLLTIQGIIEMATELKDEHTAQAAYDALSPYADLPIMASLAVVCFGSAHRPLGVAALTCGKLDLAIEHFAAAVAASERLGHRPAATQARAELGLALQRRSHTGDGQRGRTLVEEAMTEANTLGMRGLIPRWQEALAATKEMTVGTGCDLVSISSAPQGGWCVALGAHIATVPDLVGVRYLARLVAEPNRDVPAWALVVGQATLPPLRGRQEVMDADTVVAVRTRIHTLKQQPVLAPEEQDELDALTRELVRVSGLGGRIRSFAEAPERARTAVRKAVKRAIEQVSAANPVVGRHLTARIETGATCRYRTPQTMQA
jgi:tetratricopeptide (TPR) repeat protein